ncbi:MAG: trichothecene 15-O-acetyltransferase [Claussenomyces sp. TS43310]|nr:MAG: trichothecene 15-O-acetyltransferase [Claussenomyces sp. TS43310]
MGAWRRLRLLHLEIATTPSPWKLSSPRFVQCSLSGDEPGWLDKTFFSVPAADSLSWGFEEMRSQLIARSRDQPEPAFILLHERTAGSHVDLMLLVDHLVADGVGVRILLGRYLSLLADELLERGRAVESKAQIDWSLSSQHLTPPWTSLMNEKQKFQGPEYEAAVEQQFKFLISDTTANWGLPVLPPYTTTDTLRPAGDDSSTTAHHIIGFTQAQTSTLLHLLKSKLGPTATITHLAHAATILALLRCNTLPNVGASNSNESSHSSTLFSPCWMNGRRYLIPDSRHPDPEHDYVPICQAMGQVVFQDLPFLATDRATPRAEVYSALLRACYQAMESYAEIKARKSILAESIPLVEYLGDQMQLTHEVGLKPVVYERAAPFLLSDGIGERYIHRSYGDGADGVLFEVRQLRFVANAEGPNL